MHRSCASFGQRWPLQVGRAGVDPRGAELARSMSAKEPSPSSTACEGLFGRLRNELLCCRDWRGVSAESFMARLDACMRHHCESRIKRSLGWLSPDEHRRAHGYAV